MLCYARVIAHYPYVVLVSVMIVSVTCLIVTLTIGSLPSFDEPMAGFEPRGTEISDRLTTYHNLINDPDLSSTPSEQNAIVQENNNKLVYLDTINPHINTSTHRVKRRRQKTQFFCDVPNGDYIKVVYQEHDKEDLFTLWNIQSMCTLEEQYITSNSLYKSHCVKVMKGSSDCCHTWSLGNYIAMLTNKPSCSNITEADVIHVKNLVETCVGFYQNFSLSDNCDETHSKFGDSDKTCKNITKQCKKYNGIYNIMHFIADNSFQRTDKKLTYTISFLPLAFPSTDKKLKDILNLYLNIESNMEPVGKVKIIAADFGIKKDLFHHYLAKDSLWISVSAVLIFLIVWIFTGSIFITIMTFVTMFFSLELAYFAYEFVFKIKFFPYMNLVTVLLVIAIGADDVFVYSKIWHLAKRQRNNGTLEKLVSDTLKHATLSMFVTSLTTAGALLSNIVSPITSIKCFSIFAGTTVVCNLLLMVTAMPAAVVAEEKWCNFCFINSPKFYKRLRSYYRRFFEMLLPKFVLKLRYVWIVFLTIAGIISGILVFHYPKLQLPTSFHFQMFHDSHLMEIYDKDLRENFWFEKSVGDRMPLMPLTIVWGVQSQDNGDKFNPNKKGTLQYDYSFNPSMPRSQAWLRQFCSSLRETAFYKRVSLEQNNCFIENFIPYMNQTCTAEEVICCQKSVFPFDENIFETCIRKYIPLSLKTNIYNRNIAPMGLKFRGNKIAALIVNFSSNVTYTYEFNIVQKFYMEMNTWVMEQIKSAPAEMSNCWFVSELNFFGIQKSLADGLPVAFGISILVATLVTFLTSLNFLITVYAMLTISFIMLVTVASIVLLGWELNILESVIITIAVGLSIDYTLHYGVAFRVCSDMDTHNRTFSTLARVGSVMFVAAATTFIGGLVMLLSTTLVYQKFGIFLMLVIAISWIFSTLFFSSLLNVIGPHGAFGQFHWPSLDCCSLSSNTHKDRTVYRMSESTMSTSSSGCRHPSTDISITEHDYLTDRSPSSHQGSKLDRSSDSRRGSKPDRSPSSHRGSKPDRSPDSHRESKFTQNTSSLAIDNQFQWKLLGGDDIFDKNSNSDHVAMVVPDLSSSCRKLCTQV